MFFCGEKDLCRSPRVSLFFCPDVKHLDKLVFPPLKATHCGTSEKCFCFTDALSTEVGALMLPASPPAACSIMNLIINDQCVISCFVNPFMKNFFSFFLQETDSFLTLIFTTSQENPPPPPPSPRDVQWTPPNDCQALKASKCLPHPPLFSL